MTLSQILPLLTSLTAGVGVGIIRLLVLHVRELCTPHISLVLRPETTKWWSENRL